MGNVQDDMQEAGVTEPKVEERERWIRVAWRELSRDDYYNHYYYCYCYARLIKKYFSMQEKGKKNR